MAIRFQCSACTQPIEVDDEWARKAVACPYCRRTITAPGESTLGDMAQIPTAQLVYGAPGESPAGSPGLEAQPPSAPVPHPNTIAVVALCLAIGSFVLGAGYVAVSFSCREETAELVRPGMSLTDIMRTSSDFMERHPDLAGRMLAGTVMALAAGLAWLAGWCAGLSQCSVPGAGGSRSVRC